MLKQFWQNHSTPALCAKLGVLAVAMFAFALFIMPPLYDLFCEVTGLNGKTGGPFTAESDTSIDYSRQVKVQFLAVNNEGMPWEFSPKISSVKVHPGEPQIIYYQAFNPTDKSMIAQAVPSLVPFKAANYFHKTECFCFNQQPLAAGETADLGLSFIVDKDLPKHVNTITLSYTLFDITEQGKTEQSSAEQNNNKQQLANITM